VIENMAIFPSRTGRGFDMMHIILAGKAKEVFAELEKMLKMEQATGHTLMKYIPDIQGRN